MTIYTPSIPPPCLWPPASSPPSIHPSIHPHHLPIHPPLHHHHHPPIYPGDDNLPVDLNADASFRSLQGLIRSIRNARAGKYTPNQIPSQILSQILSQIPSQITLAQVISQSNSLSNYTYTRKEFGFLLFNACCGNSRCPCYAS